MDFTPHSIAPPSAIQLKLSADGKTVHPVINHGFIESQPSEKKRKEKNRPSFHTTARGMRRRRRNLPYMGNGDSDDVDPLPIPSKHDASLPSRRTQRGRPRVNIATTTTNTKGTERTL